jgi:hypothetical protein
VPRLSLLLICYWTCDLAGWCGGLDVSLSCCDDIYELFTVDYFTSDLNFLKKQDGTGKILTYYYNYFV